MTLFEVMNTYWRSLCTKIDDQLILHVRTIEHTAKPRQGSFASNPAFREFKAELMRRSTGHVAYFDSWKDTYEKVRAYAAEHGFPDEWEGRKLHESVDRNALEREMP